MKLKSWIILAMWEQNALGPDRKRLLGKLRSLLIGQAGIIQIPRLQNRFSHSQRNFHNGIIHHPARHNYQYFFWHFLCFNSVSSGRPKLTPEVPMRGNLINPSKRSKLQVCSGLSLFLPIRPLPYKPAQSFISLHNSHSILLRSILAAAQHDS